jgi:ribonuclease G
MKRVISSFEMPKEMGLICRTASVNASLEVLVEEANDLIQTWHGIVANFNKATRPTCLYEESDLVRRAVMTAVDKRCDRMLIDDYATYHLCKRLYAKYCEEHPLKIELYRDKTSVFERFHVEREIEKALRRKVWLPGGGYLFFDRTEAMYTIDVNSGRSSGQSSHSDLEESLVHINMEAAEEIARQLRLRNIGGLVICDFIDMRSRKNQKRVLDRLKEAMREDSAKCTILGMSEFGLVEMTRQRSRESLMQTLFTNCPYCSGSGLIKSHESISIEIERSLKKLISQKQFGLELISHPELDHYLGHTDKDYLAQMAEKLNAQIRFQVDDRLHLNEFLFYSTINGKRIDI